MATYSILRQPAELEPAFQNSIAYHVDSSNATQSNFRYIFDVYTGVTFSATYSFRTTVSTFPRTDGTCIYSPHYVLADQLGVNFTPTIITMVQATQSAVFYKLGFGEAYNPNLFFRSINNGSINGTQSVILVLDNIVDIVVGDSIRIDKTDISLNPQYNTTAKVLTTATATLSGVPTTFVGTSIPFGVTVSGESGYIIDLQRQIATSSVREAFNGSRQYDELNRNFQTEYIMASGSNAKFLSVYEGNKPIYHNLATGNTYGTYETLSFLTTTASNWASLSLQIISYDSNGNSLFATNRVAPTSFKNGINRFDVGMGTINTSIFNVTNLTSYYLVYLRDPSLGSTYSEVKRYDIIKQCREYDLVTLAFKNKLGGIDYWTFNLLSKYKTTIKRDSITKVLPWNYSIGDRGRKVINQEIMEEWEINTEYLTDNQALFIQQLVESPEVYVLQGTNKIPIIITSDEYQFKSSLNDQLVQYTITFVMANDIISNI